MPGLFPGITSVALTGVLTGLELIPADTQLTQGQFPETEMIPVSVLINAVAAASRGGVGFTNMLFGGDFTINPFQRGTSFTGITNGATYTADRWAAAAGSSGQNIVVSSQTVSTVAGFTTALQIGRTAAGTNLGSIQIAQAVESGNSLFAQGQPVTLSFWAAAGSSFSSASLGLAITIASGTGTNGSVANLLTGSWTGFVSNALTLGANTSFIPGSSTQIAITTTMTRYTVSTTMPAAAVQLGVVFGYTPVGTAAAGDSFQIMGVQLELGNTPSSFEHRDPGTELAECQRYFQQINEVSGAVYGAGMVTNGTTNNETITLPLPVTMRTTPTATLTAGGFRFNVAGTSTAVGAGFAQGSSTATYVTLTGTAAAASGLALTLFGSSATGIIALSSEL